MCSYYVGNCRLGEHARLVRGTLRQTGARKHAWSVRTGKNMIYIYLYIYIYIYVYMHACMYVRGSCLHIWLCLFSIR